MAVATQEVLAGQVAAQAPSLPNKSLISDQLWTRLVNRIVKDENVEPAMAERILDQALGFLSLCSQTTGASSYSPSEMVDIGWHTMILYTREYAELCQRLAGRFIHHCPTDEEGVDYGEGGSAQTVVAMKAAGIYVDEELWEHSANCQKCGQKCGNNCQACNAS